MMMLGGIVDSKRDLDARMKRTDTLLAEVRPGLESKLVCPDRQTLDSERGDPTIGIGACGAERPKLPALVFPRERHIDAASGASAGEIENVRGDRLHGPEQSLKTEPKNQSLLLCGDVQFRLAVVAQPPLQRFQHLVGAAPGCTDEEHETESLEVRIVGLGETTSDIVRCTGHSRLLAHRPGAGRSESRTLGVITTNARVMSERLQPIVGPQSVPRIVGPGQQRVDVAEGSAFGHQRGPRRRAAAAMEGSHRLVAGEPVELIKRHGDRAGPLRMADRRRGIE